MDIPPDVCDRKDCNEPPKYQLGFLLYAPKKYGQHPPAECEIGVFVCESHGKEVVPEDLITEEGWKKIVREFRNRGFAKPDRSRTQIRLLPILKL